MRAKRGNDFSYRDVKNVYLIVIYEKSTRLTFLGEDNPERIIELITVYPQFKGMYETLYRMCRDIERVMGMFSLPFSAVWLQDFKKWAGCADKINNRGENGFCK